MPVRSDSFPVTTQHGLPIIHDLHGVVMGQTESGLARSWCDYRNRIHDLISLFEHDLFGKPVSTFPDHAPKKRHPLITCRYFVADLGAASAE
jgi:hypothetical protein